MAAISLLVANRIEKLDGDWGSDVGGMAIAF